MILAATTDKIQLVTDAAVTVDVHASYVDLDGTTVTPGRKNTAITTATTTDIVASPGSGVLRNVKSIQIRNKHASSSVKVTAVYEGSATDADVELHAVTLLAGEALEYREDIGWYTLTAQGIANPVQVFRLGSNQSNSTTTLTEVTGLTAPTGTGTYLFEYYLITQSAATTTGQRFSVNHDGTVTDLVAWWRWVDNSATASTAAADQDAVAAAGQVMGAMAARAGSTTGWGTTISVDSANANMLVVVEGIVVVTVAGNLELWHGSEVAAASSVRAGSSLRLTKTA